jgi:hypothetical protein
MRHIIIAVASSLLALESCVGFDVLHAIVTAILPLSGLVNPMLKPNLKNQELNFVWPPTL